MLHPKEDDITLNPWEVVVKIVFFPSSSIYRREFVTMETDPCKLFFLCVGIIIPSYNCSSQVVSVLQAKISCRKICNYMPVCTIPLFFSVSFFPLSFSFMLAPPFQCSSIFLVSV